MLAQQTVNARPNHTTRRVGKDVKDSSAGVSAGRATLGPGVIGHILRNRSINVASSYIPSVTDRWFHYDQVGSVMSETNASGALAKTHYPDAFGNRMASWTSGLWTNTYAERKGWGHNSKEFDGDTGVVYQGMRWFNSQTGTFVSKDLLESKFKGQYYAWGPAAPTMAADNTGLVALNLEAWDEAIQVCTDKHKDTCYKRTGADRANYCDFVNCVIDEYYSNGGEGYFSTGEQTAEADDNGHYPPGLIMTTNPVGAMENCFGEPAGTATPLGHIWVTNSTGEQCHCLGDSSGGGNNYQRPPYCEATQPGYSNPFF